MEVIVKGRLAFPDLFVAKQFQGAGDYSYAATALMDEGGSDAQAVEAAIKRVANEAWKDKADGILKTILNNPQKCCSYSGDLKDYDGFGGAVVLTAKRKQKDGHPRVIDRQLQDLDITSGLPYGGCYVKLKADIWAQDNQWGKGIRATLITVQFLGDAAAFSATGPADTEGFKEEADMDGGGLI